MYYRCVKYCQNKFTKTRLLRFPQVYCRFTAELQDISRKRSIAWFRAIKFKTTNVSIDSIDDCRTSIGENINNWHLSFFLFTNIMLVTNLCA